MPRVAVRAARDAGGAAARAADRLLDRRPAGAQCPGVEIGGVLDRAPVLITQHMPPTFTAILAEHLARVRKRPVHEAQDGEEINAGTIYLAPGGKHMSVVRRDGIAVIALDDGPPVNFCKPSVDPLFSSAAQVWGPKALALVLTGMGSDGLRGAQATGRRRRHHPGAGRGVERGLGHARPGRAMPASARRCCRWTISRPTHARVRGRARMTPQDFDYLRQLLRQRSGLVLSAEKQYLAESRLLPVARKHGMTRLAELVGQAAEAGRATALERRGGRGDDHQRDFLLPRQAAVRAFPRHHRCRR